MKIFLAIIGVLLIADALFLWANLEKMGSFINKIAPKLNPKVIMLVEGILGSLLLAAAIL